MYCYLSLAGSGAQIFKIIPFLGCREVKVASILVTGTAGFIGYHLSNILIEQGHRVHGFDGMTDYYDVALKRHRHDNLDRHKEFSRTEAMLEDNAAIAGCVANFQPDVIVHLAAQAGVRYSLENPRDYINSNVVGTFNVMEAARINEVGHLLMASTSSAYGANTVMPFIETEKADTQLTIYAATKKATENLGHSYAHLYNLPTTMFRFFSVFGPMGRPDLALFKFVERMLRGDPIDIYNNGQMYRDFTYVTDLVRAISLLIEARPEVPSETRGAQAGDSLSPVAPFRIVNIGNSEKIRLLDFIDAIEDELGIKAERNYMGMQTGDVPATHANTDLLQRLTGYVPSTPYQDGIREFVDWYCEYYGHRRPARASAGRNLNNH